MYLDEAVKLKLSLVNMLKKMNTSYPNISEDFDRAFIHHLLRAIFSNEEMKKFADTSSQRSLPKPKLQLAKGNLCSHLLMIGIKLH